MQKNDFIKYSELRNLWQCSKFSKLKSICRSHLRFICHSTANHVKADALSDGKISMCLDYKYVKTKIGFKSTLNNHLKSKCFLCLME